MRDLQETTERICELKGNMIAIDAFVTAMMQSVPADERARLAAAFTRNTEVTRALLLHAEISDISIAAFEHDAARMQALLARTGEADAPPAQAPQSQHSPQSRQSGPPLQSPVFSLPSGALPATADVPFSLVDPVLLAVTRVQTFAQGRRLSGATGFFFERDERLYLVTSGHVFLDPLTNHAPDRVHLELHPDDEDFTKMITFTVPLYADGERVWLQASDSEGDVDVAVILLDRSAMPRNCALRAFTPGDLQGFSVPVPVGSALTIVGFPLGFHDTVHHLPVARQAALASSYGTRFQGQGLFITDARTHRGSSGAPVMLGTGQVAGDGAQLPWKLLGIHSSRMDMSNRDLLQDESLGLNCAWYADTLLNLTA